MIEDDSIQRFTGEIATALMPLEWILGSTQLLQEFLKETLGYDIPETLTTLGIEPQIIQALLDALDHLCDELAKDVTDKASVAVAWATLAIEVSKATSAVFTGPTVLANQLEPAFLYASRIVETLPRRLMDWLIFERLRVSSPILLRLMALFGVVETFTIAADASTFTTAHQRRVVHYDRISRVLSDPVGLLTEVYGWGAPGARLDVLLARLASLVTATGGRHEFLLPSAMLKEALYDPATPQVPAEVARPPQLRIPLVRNEDADSGLSFVIIPPLNVGGAPGLGVVPFASAGLTVDVPIDSRGYWTLSFRGSVDATAGIGIIIRPGQPLRGPFGHEGTGEVTSGALTIELCRREPTGDPISILALGSTFGLTATELSVGAGFVLVSGVDEVFVELGIRGGELTLDMTKADSFIRQVLPQTLTTRLELTLGLSSRHGAYFRGGTGLEITQPLNVTLGQVYLTSVVIALAPGADQLELVVGLSAAVRVGPVIATVDRIGTWTRAIVPNSGGNLGPIDVEFDFKCPSGVGLSIDSGTVSGSGFLSFNANHGQYAGALHLEVEGIALSAVGLLTTRLPDGSDGFSLIVLVTGYGSKPIPLGYGFTLTGVGGLVGVNRSINIDVLRAGLRQRTVDPVLFSEDDPVPRAAQIISTLQTIFPPAVGRYVFGPVAKIEWGTPTVLTLELALVLELPSPLRLIILGHLHALLPPAGEQRALVKLSMDAIGLIEFDNQQASVDAVLYDSSIAGFPITGDMALRMLWGKQPAFALAVGGFHPRFVPPPGFPSLRRLAIPLSTGNNPRLRLEAYLALTSNTVQVGARLDLYVEAAGFALAGLLAFDALVQFAPFWLDLEIAGAVALKRDSNVLMSVEVRLHLTGPAPWHALGEAIFRILFFKVSVAFEATFGELAAVEAPRSTAIWPLLQAALADAGNWEVQLPGRGSGVATVRGVPSGEHEIMAHPLALLAVRQRVIPLERDISRFANVPPADFHRFAIESVRVGTQIHPHVSTYDAFAPAQFANMTEDERLQAPGFDQMPAGAKLVNKEAVAGPERSVTLQFETVMLGGTAPVAPYIPASDTVARLAEIGAAAMARSRRMGRTKYTSDSRTPIRVRDPEFVLVTRDGLTTPRGAPATDGSYSSAREAMAAFKRLYPRVAPNVQIARREEVLT